MRNKPSISRSVLWNMTYVAVGSIILLGVFWIFNEYRLFRNEISGMREAYLSVQKDEILDQVEKIKDFIEYEKTKTEARLKKNIKERVYEAHAIADGLYRLHKDTMSRGELIATIKEALRPIRFNNGRGYFFATYLNGIELLFADRPDMEGKDMLPVRGARGEYVVRDMIDLINKDGEGFYRYSWTKPDMEGKGFPKIAFVKLFEPFQFFIGTGDYLDDVEKDIQVDALERIGQTRFGKGGYMFAGRWDAAMLTAPAPGRIEALFHDAKNEEIVRRLNRMAKQGGGYLEFELLEEGGETTTRNLGYIRGIPEWKWYIGAVINIDAIEGVIGKKREEVTRKIFGQVINIVLISWLLIFLALLYARRVSAQSRAGHELFADFFRKAARESTQIDPESMAFVEYEELARSANQMLEARLQAEATLERFFHISLDLMCITGMDGKFIYVNPAFNQVLGYSREDMMIRSFMSRVHPEDTNSTVKAMKELGRGIPVVDFENRFLAKDGSYRWLSWTSIPVPDEQIVYSVARDITEKMRIELENRSRANIVHTIPIGLFVFQYEPPDRLILMDGNQESERLTGIRAEDQAGREFNEIWPQAEEHGLNTAFLEVMRNHEVYESTETLNLDDHGETTVKFKAFEIPGQRLCVAFEDITETRKAELEKDTLEKQLRQAQKMEAIGTLAGGIAHDFNNILGAIIGYTELTQLVLPENEPSYQNLKQVLDAAARAKDLVRQILTFSRQSEPQVGPVEVTPILKEGLRFLRSSLPSTIEIRQTIPSKAPSVMADPIQIHQVLMNLCTNAAQAMMNTGGVIDVKLVARDIKPNEAAGRQDIAPGKYLQLTVSDTGQGMRPEIMERIFEPYFTTKEQGGGTGMGLAVVHGIVKSHGGDIQVFSEPGRGTAFVVSLPVSSTIGHAAPSEPSDAPLGREQILFVDDEQALVEIAGDMLTRWGYRVETASDPLEALALIKSQPDRFDLVITDQTMPSMTGIELSRELLTMRPDLPIILCTGYSETITEENVKSYGIGAFLLKPLSSRELGRTMRSLLDAKA